MTAIESCARDLFADAQRCVGGLMVVYRVLKDDEWYSSSEGMPVGCADTMTRDAVWTSAVRALEWDLGPVWIFDGGRLLFVPSGANKPRDDDAWVPPGEWFLGLCP